MGLVRLSIYKEIVNMNAKVTDPNNSVLVLNQFRPKNIGFSLKNRDMTDEEFVRCNRALDRLRRISSEMKVSLEGRSKSEWKAMMDSALVLALESPVNA